VVIGNSSSGIIEVPAFGIPTVNIGLRQKGRLAADSVIHCSEQYESLQAAFTKALSASFRKACQRTKNPYGNGRVSEQILPIIKQAEFSTLKHFHSMEFDYADQ
jgi:UDP-N-acetylglucosamine 2-epimerase (non-hydrolysing)